MMALTQEIFASAFLSLSLSLFITLQKDAYVFAYHV